jgi:tetratricopeptide (TPR) repeat protein
VVSTVVLRRAVLGLYCIIFSSLPANAQTLLRGPGAAALDPLFRQVLQKPNEVELNLAFARRAIELEDFEAAVATLERLLIGRSGLPLLRLELGMLYLRLEAPELAEAYLLQVLEAKDIDATARQRAEILLSETRKANAKGSFAMSVSLGTKHASNAVARPRLSNLIAYNDLQQEADPTIADLELDSAQTDKPDSDTASTGSISVSYSRELDGLTERRFNASLNQYSSRQNDSDLSTLDIDVTSLRMGLTLPLARSGKSPLTLSP